MKTSALSVLGFVSLFALTANVGRGGTISDAVNDFSLSSNPNGRWSYLYDTGSGLRLLANALSNVDGEAGYNQWWDGENIPNSIAVSENSSSATLVFPPFNTIVDPPNLIALDPESGIVDCRWTAPESGTWSVTGLFQGIDTGENAHNVEILENYSMNLLAPTTMSGYGQVVPFNQSVNLNAGATVDFLVVCTSSYGNLATGLSATISPIPTPEPSTLSLVLVGAAGLLAVAWRRNLGNVVEMRPSKG
jgi:hypothetical protein